MSSAPNPGQLPAHVQLIQIGTAYWGSQMVFTAAQLELADRLAAGARSAGDLARELDLNAPALYRAART